MNTINAFKISAYWSLFAAARRLTFDTISRIYTIGIASRRGCLWLFVNCNWSPSADARSRVWTSGARCAAPFNLCSLVAYPRTHHPNTYCVSVYLLTHYIHCAEKTYIFSAPGRNVLIETKQTGKSGKNASARLAKCFKCDFDLKKRYSIIIVCFMFFRPRCHPTNRILIIDQAIKIHN